MLGNWKVRVMDTILAVWTVDWMELRLAPSKVDRLASRMVGLSDSSLEKRWVAQLACMSAYLKVAQSESCLAGPSVAVWGEKMVGQLASRMASRLGKDLDCLWAEMRVDR